MPKQYYKTRWAILDAIRDGIRAEEIVNHVLDHLYVMDLEGYECGDPSDAYILNQYKKLKKGGEGSERIKIAAQYRHFKDRRNGIKPDRATKAGDIDIKLSPVQGVRPKTLTVTTQAKETGLLIRRSKMDNLFRPATLEDAQKLRNYAQSEIDRLTAELPTIEL